VTKRLRIERSRVAWVFLALGFRFNYCCIGGVRLAGRNVVVATAGSFDGALPHSVVLWPGFRLVAPQAAPFFETLLYGPCLGFVARRRYGLEQAGAVGLSKQLRHDVACDEVLGVGGGAFGV
jgi:hypothetical protein